MATRIVRDGEDSVVLIQGPVSNIAQPDFDILSVHITTEDGSTQYKDQLGNSIEIAEFFDPVNLYDGRLVRAYGPWSAATETVTADEVQHQ